jgi:hypothetical protein
MKPALSLEEITIEKQLLITISATIINIYFLFVYYLNDLNVFDSVLITMMFMFNLMVMYFLEVKDVEFLNILHMCMVFCFMISIFIDNYYYILILVIVLIEIQLLWVKFGKCILFNDKEGWGFGLAPHVGATTYTAFLSYKLGIKTLLKGLK